MDAKKLVHRNQKGKATRFRKVCTSFYDFIDFFENETWELSGKPTKLIMSQLVLSYDPLVPNSHTAPRNGVVNFMRNETFRNGEPKPIGYPGYKGHIRFLTDCYFDEMAHRFLNRLGICTMSGSSSGMHHQYDCNIFLDDWPALAHTTTLRLLITKDIRELRFGYYGVHDSA